jgi:hypothetical protein
MSPIGFALRNPGTVMVGVVAVLVGSGLAASTLATLALLPAVFAVVQRRATVAAASLDPDDPQSRLYDEDKVTLFDDPDKGRG